MMQLISGSIDGNIFLGAQVGSWVVNLKSAYQAYALSTGRGVRSFEAVKPMLADMLSLLREGEDALSIARETLGFAEEQMSTGDIFSLREIIYPLADIRFLPPVPRPGKVICVGLNYPDRESNAVGSRPEYPVLFHKVSTSLTGHNHPIIIPRITNLVLYEGELALVIGRPGKYIHEEEAETYIAGYTVSNDVGAPDLESRTPQWTTGKMSDTFCPLGPVLVTRDEIPAADNLWIKTSLNGEIVQHGNTGEMYFDIPFLVSYISELVSLEPGDLILTGSPKKIGLKPDPRTPMAPGDSVSVEITGIGILANHVVAEE